MKYIINRIQKIDSIGSFYFKTHTRKRCSRLVYVWIYDAYCALYANSTACYHKHEDSLKWNVIISLYFWIYLYLSFTIPLFDRNNLLACVWCLTEVEIMLRRWGIWRCVAWRCAIKRSLAYKRLYPLSRPATKCFRWLSIIYKGGHSYNFLLVEIYRWISIK